MRIPSHFQAGRPNWIPIWQTSFKLRLSGCTAEPGSSIGLEERIALSNDDYTVSNINLQFHQYSDKIEYVVTCDATFRIRMFGELFPPITQHITLAGSHNTKY